LIHIHDAAAVSQYTLVVSNAPETYLEIDSAGDMAGVRLPDDLRLCRRASQDVVTPALFERVIGALRVAMQMAEVAGDWNLDEVEIDGEMWRTWDIREQMRTLLADLGRPQEGGE